MTAPLTPDQERAALEACEAATPGPWLVEVGHDETHVSAQAFYVAWNVGNDDAAFIAISRTALPVALATVAAQREERAAIARAVWPEEADASESTTAEIVEAIASLHDCCGENGSLRSEEARAGEAALADVLRRLSLASQKRLDSVRGSSTFQEEDRNYWGAIADAQVALSGATGRAWAEERRALLDVAVEATRLYNEQVGNHAVCDMCHARLGASLAALAKVRR